MMTTEPNEMIRWWVKKQFWIYVAPQWYKWTGWMNGIGLDLRMVWAVMSSAHWAPYDVIIFMTATIKNSFKNQVLAFITGWKSNCVDIVAIWFHHFCVLLILVPPFQAMFQFNLQSLRFKNSHRQKSSQGCRFWVLVKAFSSDQHRVGSCIIFGNMIGRSEKCIRQ